MVEDQFCGQSTAVRLLTVTFKYTFRVENEGTTVPYPAVKRAGAVEDVSPLGEETEDQPRHETVHVVATLSFAPLGIVLQQLDVSRFRRLVARMSKAFSLICLTVVMPARGRKKPKWSGKC